MAAPGLTRARMEGLVSEDGKDGFGRCTGSNVVKQGMGGEVFPCLIFIYLQSLVKNGTEI
jgi:hypothetical protein